MFGPLAFHYLHAETVSDRCTPPPSVRRCHGYHVFSCCYIYCIFLLVLRYLVQLMPTKATGTSTTLISTLLGKVLVYSVLLAFMHVFLCGCNCHYMVFINHVFLAAYGRYTVTLVCSCLVIILLKTLRYLWIFP